MRSSPCATQINGDFMAPFQIYDHDHPIAFCAQSSACSLPGWLRNTRILLGARGHHDTNTCRQHLRHAATVRFLLRRGTQRYSSAKFAFAESSTDVNWLEAASASECRMAFRVPAAFCGGNNSVQRPDGWSPKIERLMLPVIARNRNFDRVPMQLITFL